MSKHIPSHEELIKKVKSLEEKVKRIDTQRSKAANEEAELQEIADSMSLLCDTQDSLNNTFTLNMKAFEKHYPDIYQFYVNYKPKKYFVEINEGFANILDSEQESFIYPYPSYLMANLQVNSYQEAPQSTQSMFHLNEDNEGNFIHSSHLNGIIHLIIDSKEGNQGKVRPLSKDINSFIVFGVGLGYHIDLIINQHNISNLYIVETDLDLFYASLFTANWSKHLEYLSAQECSLHISLGPQEEDFFDDIQKKSNINGRYEAVKTFGYIHYNTPDLSNLVSQYQERFYEMIQGWGFFDDGVISISHLLSNLSLGVPLLRKSNKFINDIADVPVFIVGNGPSLDDLIDTLKLVKDHGIIISCGSALSALYKYGIIPDLHCEQERTLPVAEKLGFYCPKEILRKIPLFAPATVHPEVFKKFDNAFMAIKGQEPATAIVVENENYRNEFQTLNFINPTVANTALSIGEALGFQKFYFLGVDLGHKDGEGHHSKKSLYYDEKETDLKVYDTAKNSDIKSQGNFGGTFSSNGFFSSSRKMLEKLIKQSPSIQCFNLSDGVQIRGAAPLFKEKLVAHLGHVSSNISSNDKQAKLDELIQKAIHLDPDNTIGKQVESQLDFAGFKVLCDTLIKAIDMPTDNLKAGLHMLEQHTNIIRDETLCPSENFYLLMQGTVLHMQAMLMRLLYEAVDEKVAIDKFNEGKQHYKAFLQEAPQYYINNADVPHEMYSDFFKPLHRARAESDKA